MKKIIAKMIVLVLIVTLMSGCWNRRELDDLAIVIGISFDKGDLPGQVETTSQIVIPSVLKSSAGSMSTGSGGGGGQKAFWNLKGVGNSVFETLRGDTKISNRKLYIADNQVQIFSMDLAKEGIRKYLDFFLRDPEGRMSELVLISRGRAGDVLDVQPQLEKIPATNIDKLMDNQIQTSESLKVRLVDFATALLSKSNTPVAPIIEIVNNGDNEEIKFTGMAVFKDDKLIGELNENETRGLIWCLGKVKSGILNVKTPSGSAFDFEIIRSKGSMTLEMDKDKKITVNVKIETEGNVASQDGPDKTNEEEVIKKLQSGVEDFIKNEIMLAFYKSQQLYADFLGFSDMIYRKYPGQWKDVKANWDTIFPKIAINMDVQVKIRNTGRLSLPAYPIEES